MNTSRYPLVRRHDQGATLIEVLVAAIVIGIGLLGIASLQLKALQGSSDAQYRSTATDVAWMVSDRIRANLPALEDYDGETTFDCTGAPANACAMVPTAGSAVGNCTEAQMITHDMYEASCLSGIDLLPGGTITITRAAAPVAGFISRFEIVIDWETRNTDSAGNYIPAKLTMSVVPGSDPGL